jgi:hypothetical protein
MVTAVLEDLRPRCHRPRLVAEHVYFIYLDGIFGIQVARPCLGQNFLFRAGAGLDKRAPEGSLAPSNLLYPYPYIEPK